MMDILRQCKNADYLIVVIGQNRILDVLEAERPKIIVSEVDSFYFFVTLLAAVKI
jgi:hypothetical protein